MTFARILMVLCLLVLCRETASSQSLAELARQEAARRQAVTPGKVITNGDLKAVPPAQAPAPASVPGTTLAPPPSLEKATAAAGETATTAAGTPKAAGEVEGDGKRDEKYWRQRVSTARDTLSRAQIFQDALQARIGALSLDFANRDDPAQRAQVERDRQTALTELERVKKDIVTQQAELAAIAAEARRANVPAGWVR
jgi:hypothetical protein